jgi:hypothetical protein
MDRGPRSMEASPAAGACSHEARKEMKRSLLFGEHTRMDEERTHMDGERTRMHEERTRMDGERTCMDGERTRMDGERTRMDECTRVLGLG